MVGKILIVFGTKLLTINLRRIVSLRFVFQEKFYEIGDDLEKQTLHILGDGSVS